MNLDQNTFAFMQLRNSGYTTGNFIQGQFSQQNEELNGQRELAMRALTETQNASEVQSRDLIGRVQDLNVLDPANKYADALKKRVGDLKSFQEKGQEMLDQQNSLLKKRRQQQSALKDTLNVLKKELANPSDLLGDFVEGYGARVSKSITGWRDPPAPPYYYNG